ncbi:MAG: sugar-binding protein, partial [Lachnospiraceae bacterium]
YKEDDVHYRVNYANEQSTDAGDPARFTSAAKVLKDEDDYEIGYIIETAVMWNGTPINGTVMGFDLQLNDSGMMGSRMSTTNIFDATGTAWQNPSAMGELILTCKEGDEGKVVKSQLQGYLKQVNGYNLDLYANPEVLDAPKQNAEAMLASETATQKEVDAALAELKEAVKLLNDGSGYISAKNLEAVETLPDPYLFLDGTYVETPEDWAKRAEELSGMYQYYMYGVWRDGTGENLTYDLNGNQLKITVEREEKSASFTVTVSVPDATKCEMPEGGWPVIVGMHGGIQEQVAVANGYATVILNTYEIASDDNKHTGAFYQLYPYGESWKEQTGVLLAWSWGASKVLDALEAGLGAELNISAENSVITGVSRWGKAAAVCGAFETRFKLVAPSCSGAGGLAVYRYTSEGKTYDFTSKDASSAYTYGQNEPLGSLQATGEQGWFNDMFLNFSGVEYLPVDQYMLASLCADEDRYLFIIGSCIYEDWVNAPSMYLCYKAANSVYSFLGLEDHIAVNIHKEGHAVIEEDMRYIIDYFNYHVYGKEPSLDLSDLKTSVFEEDANYDPLFDEFNAGWYR